MTQPHWDLKDLLERLKPIASDFDTPLGNLKREAHEAIQTLMDTNRDLHRRVQKEEVEALAGLLNQSAIRGLQKARRDAAHSKEWAISSFSRMGHAFREIKRIYEQIRRVRPDGCDGYGYHSVMDSKFGEETPPGTVWANIFQTKRGGIVSVRPAEAIVDVVEELIRLRADHGRQ